MIRWIGVVFCALSIICGCENPAFYQQTHTLEEGLWLEDRPLKFEFSIQDTTLRYAIILKIDHSTDYAHQNIYLQTTTNYPQGQSREQLLPIDFANASGYWYGDCRGRSCTVTVTLQENAYFDQLGTHAITFEQFTRESNLEGINRLLLEMQVLE